MEKYFDVLRIKPTNSTDKIKEAYYKMIKEYTPEKSGEEFIRINEAYKEITKFIVEKENYKIDICLEKISKEKVIDNDIRYIKKSINNKNFKSVNEIALTKICELKKIGDYEKAVFITCLLRHIFKELNLNGLARAYEDLEFFIMKV